MGATFEAIVSFENLHAAAWQVFRGKRNKSHANAFFLSLEDRLLTLERELREGTYRPGDYRTFWIRDPKPRLISAAPLRDRVVHHAVVRVLEPRFERRFIEDSYACRSGKGQHRALDRFVGWARSSRYALMLDVHRFFPSIDHALLKAEVRRGLGDVAALALVDRIIDGSNNQEPVVRWFPGDDLLTPLERRRGLPIGNLTSQFLANVFLDRVDHFVKDRWRARKYLRYCDDLAVFHDDPGVLRELRAAIRDELGRMRLHLNEGKSRLRQPKEGLTWLGFVVRPDRVRLARRGVARSRAQDRALVRGYAEGRLDLAQVRASWLGWLGHVQSGDTAALAAQVARKRVFRRRDSLTSGAAPLPAGALEVSRPGAPDAVLGGDGVVRV